MVHITQHDMDEMFISVMDIIRVKEWPIDVAHFMLGTTFCRIAQILNLPIDKIQSDIEIIYKSLPPPIEEKDEPNQE